MFPASSGSEEAGDMLRGAASALARKKKKIAYKLSNTHLHTFKDLSHTHIHTLAHTEYQEK
jgi:hypothetical protein